MTATISVQWFVYLVRCGDNSLYTGISTDVDRRFSEHQLNPLKAARYMRGRGPLELVFRAAAGDRSRASMLEHRIKRLPREEKLRLVSGELSLEQVLP